MVTMLTSTVNVWGQNAATIFNGKPLANSYTNGVFLYNVGTGRLLIHGGDFATQARVFYQNWGDLLHLESVSDGKAVVKTNQGYFAANVPAGTDPRKYGNDITQVWQPIMDHASESLTFTRVSGESGSSTYTYHISQSVSGTTYYIGAAYGIKYDKTATGNSDVISNYMEDIGDDECTYTISTYALASTTYAIGSGTGVSAKDLYSWRIISFDDLQAAVTSGTSGLAANLSYRINDQDFTRNYSSFYDGTSGVSPSDAWVVKNTSKTSGYDSSSQGRFNYTWGFTANGQRQRHADWYGTITDLNNSGLYTSDQYWYQPLRLKEQFGDDWVWGYHLYGYTSENWTTAEGNNIGYVIKKDPKYGFMSFEGVGAVTSYVTAPVDGIYEISCVGFSQPGEGATHPEDGYLFATIGESKISSMYIGEEDDEEIKTTLLHQIPAGTYDRTSYMECMGDASLFTANGVTPVHPATFTSGAGYVLTRNQADYTNSLLIEAKAGDKIYLGVAKDYGTKTKGYVKSYTVTATTAGYVTYKAGETTYYMKADGTFTSSKDDAQVWTPSGNYLTFTSEGTTYYLGYNSSSSTSEGTTTYNYTYAAVTSSTNAVTYDSETGDISFGAVISEETSEEQETYYYITHTENGTTWYLGTNGRFSMDTATKWYLDENNHLFNGDSYIGYSWSYSRNYYSVNIVRSTSSSLATLDSNNRIEGPSGYYLRGNGSSNNNARYTDGTTALAQVSEETEVHGNTITTNATFHLQGSTSNSAYSTSDKDKATATIETTSDVSSTKTETTGEYYFDSDWVAVDNFQVTYVGNPLLVFDENEPNINYLRKYEQAGNVIDRTTYEMTTVQMERTFAEGNWNSFVCPINLTSKQVKEAFGSGVDLAELVQIGSISGSRTCIDFKKVQLPANDETAITAGKMYLIKPVAGSGHYIDGKKRYTLGANFKIFIDGGEAAATSAYDKNIDKTVAETNGYTILSANGQGWTTDNLIQSEVIEGNGGTNGENDVDGIYYKATYVNSGTNIVPAGSYVMGAKYTENTENIDETTVTMYHLKNAMAIKGFRGWLEDYYKVGGEVVARIYPTEDLNPATMIEEVNITSQVKGIFDMSGRKIVSEDLNALPKGLYIVNGKKVYVK